MTVYIIFTIAGSDTGPFNLYSDVDGYVSPFESGVSKADLLMGYTSTAAPFGTTIIRAISEGICENHLDMPVITTTSTTTTHSTTSTTTTIMCSFLLIDVQNADLNDSTGNSGHPDHTLFVSYTNCTGDNVVDEFNVADVSSPASQCWNTQSIDLYYYKDDVQTTASASNGFSGGSPCS